MNSEDPQPRELAHALTRALGIQVTLRASLLDSIDAMEQAARVLYGYDGDRGACLAYDAVNDALKKAREAVA